MRLKEIAYTLRFAKEGFLFLVLLFFFSCNNPQIPIQISQKQVVQTPKEINIKAEDVIRDELKILLQNGGTIGDSVKIKNPQLLTTLYSQNDYAPLWSAEGHYKPVTDSLMSFLDSARNYGLFPADYYQQQLKNVIAHLTQDTAKDVKLDAARWAYSDLLLSAAFTQIVKDLKVGRLVADSNFLADTSFNPGFLRQQLDRFTQLGRDSLTAALEPASPYYAKIKAGIPRFLRKADLRKFSFINSKDSLEWPQLVEKRMAEEDTVLHIRDTDLLAMPDSVAVSNVIKKYQKWKKVKVDGRLTPDFVNRLNDNDYERYLRIAISLDKFKMDPPLPKKYIFVNLPSFYMEVRDSDSVVLRSRIICGKPTTRTPVLTSAITNMVTYPQWHIPESIVKKEILPGLQRDKSYTKRKGYSLLDKDGNEVDPMKVNWAKFKENIPYNVVQGSGDDNALGILKFNFPNKYSVYLHDTNQRYLFGKTNRALSHGCVRVQAWKELANYILKNDSAVVMMDTVVINVTPIDSLNSWLSRKEKRLVPIHDRIPLYIRYITCEGKGDRITFFEDIYGEDRRIREKVFADK